MVQNNFFLKEPIVNIFEEPKNNSNIISQLIYGEKFKILDQKNNYSESGIITRKTGELIHEITKNIKSENSEKYISIYKCIRHE